MVVAGVLPSRHDPGLPVTATATQVYPTPRRHGAVLGTTPLRGSRPQDVTVSLTDVALAMFPELQRLADLRDAGWSFVPVTDDGGEVVELRGVRAWPDGYADALMVRYTTDAAGLRCNDTGALVWQREGGLAEVVDGLLTLPAPGAPGAPQLELSSRSPLGSVLP
jgi:hypothetical protein